MKNILKIFITDFRRVSVNVVAVVMVMGLCVLPSLYAWFNIFSNWDPYGQESTSNLKIAVCSEDTGTDLEGISVNVGSSVLEGLQKNSTINWVFVDNRADAVDGVYRGTYYAALVIPSNFSKKLLSFLDGSVEYPHLTYYENEKKNAIAPKITSKAKTAVQEEINSSYISSLTEALLGTGKLMNMTSGNGQNLLTLGISNLQEIDDDLQIYIATMQSFAELSNAASLLLQNGQSVLPEMKNLSAQGAATLSGMQGILDTSGQMESTGSQMLTASLDMVSSSLNQMQQQIQQERTLVADTNGLTQAEADQLQAVVERQSQLLNNVNALVQGRDATVDAKMAEVQAQVTQMQQTIQSVKSNMTMPTADALLVQISDAASGLQGQVAELKDLYVSQLEPQMQEAMDRSDSALSRAAGTLQTMDEDADTVAALLADYQTLLENGNSSIEDSIRISAAMSAELERMTGKLQAITEQPEYQELMQAVQSNPDALAGYISSPVNLETQVIYPIATYGSAMTPFYTVLALWVGALILVTILKVEVQPIEGMTIRHYQAYFGRYITFFLIGQIQALITTLGNLYYIRIQCLDPFRFWLAAAMSSFVFTLFIYSLTVAFHNVGEALAVIIMVIQVAGAGGTFPIEVLPPIYQQIYRFLPFPYAMNAMRETIGGMYGHDYRNYLLGLSAYLAVALVIGLAMGKPFRSLHHKIEKSKEKAEIML